jgi:serine/threonine-protein kinase
MFRFASSRKDNRKVMPALVICAKGHARLQDSWELCAPADRPQPCVACGAATRLEEFPAPNGPSQGMRLAGYEVLGRLHGGVMAEVYKARRRGSQRLVALKVNSSGPDASPDDRARIRREARTLSELSHPYIVGLVEAGEASGRSFLATEWLRGGTLADRLCGGPLQPADAVGLLVKLCGAVSHIHSRRFVHRDLRPSNIVFTTRGEPVLVDFGIAKRLDRPGGRTRNGAMTGDPRCMAPEQAGEPDRRIGPAADIHALGAILYQILAGQLPYQGVCLFERLRRARNPIASVTDLRPSLPVALDGICRKCLHREPRQRYATAAALADELRRVLERQS